MDYQQQQVSVPSRGEWGLLPQSVVGYDLKPDMFPYPLEVTGGSYKMDFQTQILLAKRFRTLPR